jgi:protein-tyrosine phosphatase
MCEGCFNSLRRKAGRQDLEAESAGTSADGGQPPSANAIEVMKRAGIDISGHRSRRLTAEMLQDAGVVVAMTRAHRFHIGKLLPAALKKTRLLMEFADRPDSDVADPFGGSPDVYGTCFEEIKEAVDNLFLDTIKELKS